MKITHLRPGMIDAYKAQNDKNKNINKKQNKPEHDRAEISERGRELQTYQARLKEMSGVRQDRVEDLKKRIDNGTYQPSADKIAEGILQERHSCR